MNDQYLKLAYCDTSFHDTTGSNNFLRELLHNNFDVKELSTSYWKDSTDSMDVMFCEYDVVLFFQFLPSIKKLKEIKGKRIIWVPMYDNEVSKVLDPLTFVKYQQFNLKIISFSQALHDIFIGAGLDSKYYQYYPEPAFEDKKEGIHLFFWQRNHDVRWKDLKEIFVANKNNIFDITIKNKPDPSWLFQRPSKNDESTYNIDIIEGWTTQEEYFVHVNRSNLYVAPRKYEGIGLSFLEAMSRGACVLAYDHPTMNEYITHGQDGYLFDSPKDFQKIDLSHIDRCITQMMKRYAEGHKIWEKEKQSISKWICSEKMVNKKQKYISVRKKVIYYFYLIVKKIKYICRHYIAEVRYVVNGVRKKIIKYVRR